jgi:hypothetical protein
MLTTEFMDKSAAIDYTQVGAGVAGILNGAKLIFGTNLIVPSKNSVIADITQSPDANLAPHTLVWNAAVRDSLNDIVTMSVLFLVQLALNANACNLLSWGITDSAGTHLLISGNFAVPLSLPDNVAAYNIVIPFAPAKPAGKDPLVTS